MAENSAEIVMVPVPAGPAFAARIDGATAMLPLFIGGPRPRLEPAGLLRRPNRLCRACAAAANSGSGLGMYT